jgi:hypothetical protein
MTLQYSLQRYSQALSLGTIPYLLYLAQGLRKKYIKPVIESHSDECHSVFMKAINGLGFTLTHSGELTVCKRSA